MSKPPLLLIGVGLVILAVPYGARTKLDLSSAEAG